MDWKLRAPTVTTLTARTGSCGAGGGELAASDKANDRRRPDCRKRRRGDGMANLRKRSSRLMTDRLVI
jgi:hypothetical protein